MSALPHRPHPRPRVRALLVALAVHLAALPLWVIQAFLWDFPGHPVEERARTNAALAVYAGVVMGLYVALFGALVVWWGQGRRRLFLSPLVAAILGWCPCLAIFILVPAVRRALVPPLPSPGLRPSACDTAARPGSA